MYTTRTLPTSGVPHTPHSRETRTLARNPSNERSAKKVFMLQIMEKVLLHWRRPWDGPYAKPRLFNADGSLFTQNSNPISTVVSRPVFEHRAWSSTSSECEEFTSIELILALQKHLHGYLSPLLLKYLSEEDSSWNGQRVVSSTSEDKWLPQGGSRCYSKTMTVSCSRSFTNTKTDLTKSVRAFGILSLTPTPS